MPNIYWVGGRDLYEAAAAAFSQAVEVHTYLAAVRTLSKNNVEALPAGGERSQPLKEKDRRKKKKKSNHYLGSYVSMSSDNKACFNAHSLLHTLKGIFKFLWSILRAFMQLFLCWHFFKALKRDLWALVLVNTENINSCPRSGTRQAAVQHDSARDPTPLPTQH